MQKLTVIFVVLLMALGVGSTAQETEVLSVDFVEETGNWLVFPGFPDEDYDMSFTDSLIFTIKVDDLIIPFIAAGKSFHTFLDFFQIDLESLIAEGQAISIFWANERYEFHFEVRWDGFYQLYYYDYDQPGNDALEQNIIIPRTDAKLDEPITSLRVKLDDFPSLHLFVNDKIVELDFLQGDNLHEKLSANKYSFFDVGMGFVTNNSPSVFQPSSFTVIHQPLS